MFYVHKITNLPKEEVISVVAALLKKEESDLSLVISASKDFSKYNFVDKEIKKPYFVVNNKTGKPISLYDESDGVLYVMMKTSN